MTNSTLTLDDAALEYWDAIVVGTGIGGSTVGWALARSGLKVLFLEKGMIAPSGFKQPTGYAEEALVGARPPIASDGELLVKFGRCSTEFIDVSSRRPSTFVPFIGGGGGGSSAIYGMALQRFDAADFEPSRHHAAAQGSSLPSQWPFSLEDIEEFYDSAEKLYSVQNTRSSWESAQFTKDNFANLGLATFLRSRGLHPYRLPLARRLSAGDCGVCQGHLCPRNCKVDAKNACLDPAISQHGALTLDRTEVTALRTSGRSVQSVFCTRKGNGREIHGRLIVLAAGALATPLVLLRSSNSEYPSGIGNSSGMVGRNLMRHLVDLYSVSVPPGEVFEPAEKDIGFRDFYIFEQTKLGEVQSFGALPPSSVILASLMDDLRNAGLGWLRPPLRLIEPLARTKVNQLRSSCLTLTSILEDLPYGDNRVFLSNDSPRKAQILYRPGKYDLGRLKLFRRLIRSALDTRFQRLIKQGENNHRIAHVCGTCRMGDDDRDSVVDANCRVHDLENLYIADSSVFPSSAATNPSLTIAANALRVAANITGRLHD